MSLRNKYLYGLKMIELFEEENYQELDKVIKEYEVLGSYLSFELKYKFLASNELIKYVESKVEKNTDYSDNFGVIKEMHLNSSNEEVYIFEYDEINSLKINDLSLLDFLKSNNYFINSFYLISNIHENIPSNILEIASNKYLLTDIVSFSVVFENKDMLEIPFYWYSDNDFGVNYLERAWLTEEQVGFSFDTTKQSNKYFNSFAMEELVKYSKQYNYEQELTFEDIKDIKIMYVNLGVGSIFNSYDFIQEDLLRLTNLETVVFLFEGVEESLTVDISDLQYLPNLKEISFENQNVNLIGMDKIIGKKIIL